MHNKCKNAKGLRPFKRSEPKNLRHKRTTSAKTPRGFDLSKGPNQKTFGTSTQQVQKRKGASTFLSVRTKKATISAKRRPTGCLGKIEKWMPERGRGHFKNLRHPSFDLTKTKRTKTFEDNNAKERGETFFHQKQSFRALPCRQTNLI